MSPVSRNSTGELPLGIWKFSAGFGFALFLLSLVVALGLYAFVQQMLYGDVVTGMRTVGRGGVARGSYILMYVYFVGVSFSGITISALVRR